MNQKVADADRMLRKLFITYYWPDFKINMLQEFSI